MPRLLRAAALLVPVLLAACAGPQPVQTQRWPLGYGVYLEAEVPAGWIVEPSIDTNASRTTLLRMTAREPGSTQLRVVPRLLDRAPADAGAAAARELAATRACAGIAAAVDQRALDRGGAAASCTAPRGGTASLLVPSTAGVLVRDALVVSYAMLGVSDAEAAAGWGIVRSMRTSTIRLSP